MNETLPGALAREIANLSAKIERYKHASRAAGDTGADERGMQISISIMQAELDAAIAAAGNPDPIAQISALQSLREYSLDD
ncbi:MAG: hypothetical protein MRY63_02555 [Neomegalonema sp.]|nr:hypothetical protein [Neomegalonema sp.]